MLTRRVVPTCLISPTRPMIVNSAIVFMASFLFPSPRAFGSCRRSLGCGSKEVGRAGPAPARHERAEALSEGRRRAGILSREEFGLRPKGKIVERSRCGPAYPASWPLLKPEGQHGMGRMPVHSGFLCVLPCSLLQFHFQFHFFLYKTAP